MSQLSIGIIETIGLAAAIEAADVCLKSANVTLIGYELTRGNGMTVVKIEGNVGAVKAAIEAASVAGNKVSKVYSKKVIPRPSDSIDILIRNDKTVGYEKENLDEENDIGKQQMSNVPNLDINEEIQIDDTTNHVDEVEDVEENEEDQLEDEMNEEDVDKEDEEYDESEDETLDDEDSDSNSTYTCNLCKDPKCPRVKGDLRIACIHYDEKKDD